MAWNGLYYQRSVRVNGRVTTQYFGRGIIGQGEARIAEQLAEDRRQAAEARQASRQAAEADRQRGKAVQDLVTIGLEALGFTRYSRNPWKRRKPSMTTLALPHPPSPSDQDRARVKELVAQVRGGVPGALGDLRRLSLVHPELVVRQTFTDVSKLAYSQLVGRFAGADQAIDEGLRARLRILLAELSEGPTPPSAARRLCIEAVAYAWLDHWYTTATCQNDQNRRNGAHRRLMSSLRCLAQITAAERPKPRPVNATQININPQGLLP